MNNATDEAVLPVSNPFHFLPTTREGFVGRWPLVHQMTVELAFGQSSYGVIGGRRFGKTSLLKVLCSELCQPPTELASRRVLPVFFDPMSCTFTSPERFLATLLTEVCLRCDRRLPDLRDEPPYFRVALDGTCVDEFLASKGSAMTAQHFSEAINAIVDRLENAGGPRRVILLLDEMDSLLDYTWHRELFAQLRALVVSGQARSRLRLVLAGSRRFVDEATNRGSPLLNMLRLEYLIALDEKSSCQLADRAPGWAAPVVQVIWQQSGGHPFMECYLLQQLWEAGHAGATEADVADFAELFRQKENGHLEAWSRAVGLTGLRIYGLFVEEPGWIRREAIVKAIASRAVSVPSALNALCYHGLITPDRTWAQFHRGGEIFREWYRQEGPRLIDELTPTKRVRSASVQPLIQMVTSGPVEVTYDQRNQHVNGAQYNAGENIVLRDLEL